MISLRAAWNRLRTRINQRNDQTRLIVRTISYAVAAGLVAVAFQVAIHAVHRHGLQELSTRSPAVFLGASLLLMLSGALVSGWLLTSFCPAAAGSGIPQLKVAFWKDFGYVPGRVVLVKFVAGVLQIGTGTSLGREGPSVQLAGATGSKMAGWFGEPKQRRRHGAAAGAAAGLAAAFNTPLAAVTFVLEELLGDLNSRLLGAILLAAMVGALVAHGFLGPQPAFELSPLSEPSWRSYLLVPVVAAAASLVGVAFQRAALGERQHVRSWERVPRWMRPAVGALAGWALGVGVFFVTGRLGVFGLGYEDLSDALAGRIDTQTAALLLGAKFLATVIAYGTGGCGGIFSPTLFFGAMTGLVIAGLAAAAGILPPADITLLAIIGMSATLGAVVRAPVTGILIVFEMTHQFSLVPPLMLGALVSQAISRSMLRHNFYDALLAQDGHDVPRLVPPRDLRSCQAQPVGRIASARAVVVESLVPSDLKALLDAHPFDRFPVRQGGQLTGVLTRVEALASIREQRPPVLENILVCDPESPLKVAEPLLLESRSGMVVLAASLTAPVSGVLTLHDLLRAELAAAEQDDGAL